MPYLFFPFLLLFLLTGKKVFLYGTLLALFFIILGSLFEGLGEFFGGVKEVVTSEPVLWGLGILGALCIFAAIYF